MKGLVFALLLAALPGSAATIIFQENWSGDSSGLAKGTLVNWNLQNGTNTDIGDYGANCSSGVQQCLDTQGSNGLSNTYIKTKNSFALTPGLTYTISFTLDNSGQSTADLAIGSTFGSAFLQALGGLSNGSHSFNFTASAQNAFIEIKDTGAADNVGLYIGNIVFSSDTIRTSEVPEPGTFALAGLAFAALAAGRHFRSR